MEFVVNIETNDESNFFLRALWSKLRAGKKIGWQTFGYKEKGSNTICVGILPSPLLSCAYEVKIKYTQKGCIKSILFISTTDEKVIKRDEELLKGVIQECLTYTNLENVYYITFTLESPRCIPSRSKGINFELWSKKKSFGITYKIKSFDEYDAESTSLKINSQVIDFLSTQTHQPYYDTRKKVQLPDDFEADELFNNNWVDDYPIYDGRIRLSENAIRAMDIIVQGDYSEKFEKYLGACRLYHTATKYMSFIYDFDKHDFSQVQYDLSFDEVANLLFMSSFEVLANINDSSNVTCDLCNQTKYSIRQKVIKLVEDFSDGYMSKAIVDDYYKKRSSYVHTGKFFSDRSYYGMSIPLLSRNGMGLISQVPRVNLLMLNEVGGYIFREFLEQVINDFEL